MYTKIWGFMEKVATAKEESIYDKRRKKALKTKSDIDQLWNTLSAEDKKLMGSGNDANEWLTSDESERVVKRLFSRKNGKPIAALDIMTTTKPGHLTVAIMTNPKYRGSGEASKLAKKSVDWFNKNAYKYNADYLGYGAYANNKASRRVAEKAGFIYEPKTSSNDWSVYGYRISK